MNWVNIEKETPEIGELVLVSFRTNVGTQQMTTARYNIINHSAHGDNYHPQWSVEVSRGHILNTVTHWCAIKNPLVCKCGKLEGTSYCYEGDCLPF